MASSARPASSQAGPKPNHSQASAASAATPARASGHQGLSAALAGGAAVSSGSACSSATAEPSYVLRALGRDDELANASLRFSFGRATTEADIDEAARQVIAAVARLRALAPEPDEGADAGAAQATAGAAAVRTAGGAAM